jgi:hypothetical protein
MGPRARSSWPSSSSRSSRRSATRAALAGAARFSCTPTTWPAVRRCHAAWTELLLRDAEAACAQAITLGSKDAQAFAILAQAPRPPRRE